VEMRQVSAGERKDAAGAGLTLSSVGADSMPKTMGWQLCTGPVFPLHPHRRLVTPKREIQQRVLHISRNEVDGCLTTNGRPTQERTFKE
jgi:hypothetical protein